MKQYLLDANVLGAYLQERSDALSLARTWIYNDEAATSIVVYGELTEYLKSFPDFPKPCVGEQSPLSILHLQFAYKLLQFCVNIG